MTFDKTFRVPGWKARVTGGTDVPAPPTFPYVNFNFHASPPSVHLLANFRFFGVRARVKLDAVRRS